MSQPLSPQQLNTKVLKWIGAFILCALLVMWAVGRFGGPAQLINGIASHQSVVQTKAQFPPDLSWRVAENSSLAAGDRRPQFDIYTISAPYTFQSVEGELTLHFFNGELRATIFRSPDCDKLDRKAIEAAPISRTTDLEFGDDYVSWEDKMLTSDVSDWVMAYA